LDESRLILPNVQVKSLGVPSNVIARNLGGMASLIDYPVL
jgi:hypothetical protein